MSGASDTHGIARDLDRGRATQRWLALIFIVTVLFCHGWMGAAHVAGEWPVQSHANQVHDSHAVHHEAAPNGSHVVHESIPHEYFAAFFTALLGSLLLLLRPAASRWVGMLAGLYEKKMPIPSRVPPAVRLTPQLLQVFRL